MQKESLKTDYREFNFMHVKLGINVTYAVKKIV